MAKRNDTQNQLAELFKPKKCYTIEELSHRLNYSLISIRRFLKVIGYYSSFTHNSMVQRDAHDFMRFSFYFWSFAEIADIYFLWFIKFFSLDLLMLNTSQFSG